MSESTNTALNYALERLKEPSTWAGIAIFIGFFGVSEDTVSRIVANAPAIVAALGALIAIFAPSRKKTVTVVAQQELVDSISSPLDPIELQPRPYEPTAGRDQ